MGRALTIAVALVLLALAALSGCTNASPQAQAQSLGFTASTIGGDGFQHQVFHAPATSEAADTTIVLIDGDGQAFSAPNRIARDPTPESSKLVGMMPALAQLAPVVYLGRPCYHGLANVDPACGPRFWTLARYSPKLVRSLVAALRQVLLADQQVVLAGYSGGGVLAVLMAGQLGSQVQAVVTYGAPLDTASWTTYHGYTPLLGSVNPATEPVVAGLACQRHLFGARDAQVPAVLVERWQWPSQTVQTGLDSDHGCCWPPFLQAAIAQALSQC